MDRKKKIWIIVLVVVALCIVGMRACMNTVDKVMDAVLPLSKISYEHSERYVSDSVGRIAADSVSDIVVEWISGDVDIVYADVDCIEWRETYLQGTVCEESILHSYCHDGTLYLRYCASQYEDKGHWRIFNSNRSNANLCKNLRVTLPRDCRFQYAKAFTVNGNTHAEIEANKVELVSVNGSNTLVTTQTPDISLRTVNGTLTVSIPDTTAFKAEVDKVNGAVYTDFACTQEGDTYSYGTEPWMNIEMKVVNGMMYINKF